MDTKVEKGRIGIVSAVTGLGHQTIRQLVRKGVFSPPDKFGPRCDIYDIPKIREEWTAHLASLKESES